MFVSLLVFFVCCTSGQQFISITNGIGNSPYYLSLEITPHEDASCGESIASAQILKSDGTVYVSSKNSYLYQGTLFTIEFDANGTTTFSDHLPLSIRLILNTGHSIELTDLLATITSRATFTSDRTFCGTRAPTTQSTAPSVSPTIRPTPDSEETELVNEQIDDGENEVIKDANTDGSADSAPIYVWIIIAVGGVVALSLFGALCFCTLRRRNRNTKRSKDDNDFVKTPTEDNDDGEADEAQVDDYWTAQKKSLDADAQSHKRSVSSRKSPKSKKAKLSADRDSVVLDIPQRPNRVPSSSLHLDADAEDDALMNTESEEAEAPIKLEATHSATGTMVTYEAPTNLKMTVAKPEDFDEIHVEPVDAIDYNHRQSAKRDQKGFHMDANVVAVGPTRASVLSQTEPKPSAQSKPLRQNSAHLKFSTLRNKTGVFESAPSREAEGWISADSKMFSVSREEYTENSEEIAEGFPVQFDVVENCAVNIRRITKMDESVVAQCLSNKGATTKKNATFLVEGTVYEFGNDLGRNHCVAIEDFAPNAMAARMEKCVNAFVNTEGGALFIGLGDGQENEWAVRGVARKALDLAALKRAVMDRVGMFEPFSPKLVESITELRVMPILRKNGEVVEDLVVLKVGVAGPFRDESGEAILFATAEGQKFRKNFNYITNVVM